MLYVISQAVRRVKFETILKNITSGLCQISRTHQRFVIFRCRYFKLSWNTSALSQSNCRNFSCSSITAKIALLNRLAGFLDTNILLRILQTNNPPGQWSIMDASYGMNVISPYQINSNDFKTKPRGLFWGPTEPPVQNIWGTLQGC